MKKEKEMKPERKTTFREALFVIIVMFVVLLGGTKLGLNYRLLMVAVAIFAGAMNVFVLHIPWRDCELAITNKMNGVIITLTSMWLIGCLISVMMISGSVPMVIYYGFKIIAPKLFYVTAFLLCLIMSTLTGSSWTSAGTAGVAMYGMALAMEANLPIVVGAIVAGSIFGDKMSPLSETTNMAPACVGTGLFDHIGSMMYDTLPAAIISGIVFLICGFNGQVQTTATAEEVKILSEELMQMYGFCAWKNILMLLPFIFVLWGAFRKKSMIPILSITVFLCIIIGIICHDVSLKDALAAAYGGFTIPYVGGFEEGYETSAFLAKILVRGGATAQTGIVITCFAGFGCAAMISRGGYLDVALHGLIGNMKSRISCVVAALLTNLVIMIATGTAYVAFIMVSEMYKKPFLKNRVGMPVLSRCLEDVGTCFGCLIPWSLSGAYYASLFDNMPIWGEGGYALWTVLPYVTIVIAIGLAITGIGMYKLTDEEAEAELAKMEEVETA